jgi:hypothetical protein
MCSTFAQPTHAVKLALPESVEVRLLRRDGSDVAAADLLIGVHLSAQRRNDYWLGPFPTNTAGVSVFSRDDIKAEIEATLDSGLMDYSGHEDCSPSVSIFLWSAERISRTLDSRTKAWKTLLRGEVRRWQSMSTLLDLFTRAVTATKALRLSREPSFTASWTDSTAHHTYDFAID